MEAYSDFASVYDTFMDETPYEEWADFLHGLLTEDGIEEGLVLDLGCGTGGDVFGLLSFLEKSEPSLVSIKKLLVSTKH
mgnify:CR=1 FL=1